LDDETLIRGFQAGDESCFGELVRRHRERVYRVAASVLRDHGQADEASQEAWVKAYQGLSAFKGDARFTTWMHRVTVNAALDLRAREARLRRTAESAHRGEAPLREAEPAGGGALARLLSREEIERVRAAVERLPERQRLTLLLKVREELKYTEIAEVLDCSVGTAKANVHHAVTNLRRLLAGEADASRGGGVGRRAAGGEAGTP
jgi:RNA polymerase sigma-70 factor (ECF subfamily)